MPTNRNRSENRGWLLLAGVGMLGLTGSVVGGCELIVSPDPDLLNQGGGGSAGIGSSTSTATTGATTTTTTTTTSTGGDGGAGGQGGAGGEGGAGGQGGTGGADPECTVPEDCPAPDTCEVATCSEAGLCGTTPQVAGELCTVIGGLAGFCNPSGTCVACLDADDCGVPEECQVAVCTEAGTCDTVNADDDLACAGGTCQDGACEPFPLCDNDIFDALNGETGTDCGGPNCAPCANATACILPRDCLSGVCTALTCEACDADGDCQDGNFCNLDTGVCEEELAQGSACERDTQCGSTFCVDDVCCGDACDGDCESCANAAGTCSPAAEATDPDEDCADVDDDCLTGTCNAAGACAVRAADSPCGDDATCVGGVETPADACDAAGTCIQSIPADCEEYVCGGTACRTTCTLDTHCDAGFYCEGTACVALLAVGAACDGDNECLNDQCVDGFCCDAACGGTCQACSAALKGGGTNGVCGPIADDTDPQNECAAPAAGTNCASGTCNGAGACGVRDDGAPGAPLCSTEQFCDGTNATCPADCDTDADCPADRFCDNSPITGDTGDCLADRAAAGACSAPSNCVSGVCTADACVGP